MSGGAKNITVGTGAGLLAGLALAPFTGGVSLAGGAALGASLGGSAGALKTVGIDQPAAAMKKLQSSLIKPISTPQVMPTVDNAVVQKTKANELMQLQNRSGRASTVLTNQFGG